MLYKSILIWISVLLHADWAGLTLIVVPNDSTKFLIGEQFAISGVNVWCFIIVCPAMLGNYTWYIIVIFFEREVHC